MTIVNPPNFVRGGNSKMLLLFLLISFFSSSFGSLGLLKTVVGTRTFGFGGENITATSSKIGYVRGVSTDSNGNIYFADSQNQRIRKVNKNGYVNTIAGIASNNLPTSKSHLLSIQGIWRDTIGTMYIAESALGRIRKIDPFTNTVSIFAGTGLSNFGGDNQLATTAHLNTPMGLWGDSNNQYLYIADQNNYRIRRINLATNIITTIAGTGLINTFADNCTALTATMQPRDIQGDRVGNLYFTDFNFHRIRKILPNNKVITIAGTSTSVNNGGFSGDNGLASLALLNKPQQLYVNTIGDIYFGDNGNNRIRRIIASTKIITTIIGTGAISFSGDGGQGTSATMSTPRFIQGDTNGYIYFCDSSNSKVRRWVPSTGIITTVVGSSGGYSGDGGAATSAKIWGPTGLWIDTQSNLFVADALNYRIRNVSLVSNKINTYAGLPVRYLSGMIATSSMVYNPLAMWVDTMSNVYFTDIILHMIVKVLASNNSFVVIGGTGVGGFVGENTPATSSRFYVPSGLWGDSSNNLFVADTYNHRIRKINLNTNIVTTVVGTGSNIGAMDNVLALRCNISYPNAVWTNPQGIMYVSDTFNNRIRRVDLSGIVTTLVGTTTTGTISTVDTAGTSAMIGRPYGMIGMSSSNVDTIIFTDTANRVKKISTDTNIMSIVAGGGTNAAGDLVVATTASLSFPYGICLLPDSTQSDFSFFVSEYTNPLIRNFFYVNDPTSQPTSQPSGQPTKQPVSRPTSQPTRQPTSQPSSKPSSQPISQPSSTPTNEPSSRPSVIPTSSPSSSKPSYYPTTTPSYSPSAVPSEAPSAVPSDNPTKVPSEAPSAVPSDSRTKKPNKESRESEESSDVPSNSPTEVPNKESSEESEESSDVPSNSPTKVPSEVPSVTPSHYPTKVPSEAPSVTPSSYPTEVPSEAPSAVPSDSRTKKPNKESRESEESSDVPSNSPTEVPNKESSEESEESSDVPSNSPTEVPSEVPSVTPSHYATEVPTEVPSEAPSAVPSDGPTEGPSEAPSVTPSHYPTKVPSEAPSAVPSDSPTKVPSEVPSVTPSHYATEVPTEVPSEAPSAVSSDSPTEVPSEAPSVTPSHYPTKVPSEAPSVTPSHYPTEVPTEVPSAVPSDNPTEVPSEAPSAVPSDGPTEVPSEVPSVTPSHYPTEVPTEVPSAVPSNNPSTVPSEIPSVSPSHYPTEVPSAAPSAVPSDNPTKVPSEAPSVTPSHYPTEVPSDVPSVTPSYIPTIGSSVVPTLIPSTVPSLSSIFPFIVSAVLSSNGDYVSISFNMPTNRGGYVNSFSCKEQFYFAGIETAKCFWQDDKTINIYPDLSGANFKNALEMGSPISLLRNNTITSPCNEGSNNCEVHMTARYQDVIVSPPVAPVYPMVVIKAPSEINICNDLRLDFTASNGDGGRDWHAVNVKITSLRLGSNTTILQNILQKEFSTEIPVIIPGRYLLAEETYGVDVQLCNFFRLCNHQNVTIRISTTSQSAPIVSIAGATSRTIYTTSSLSLFSSAYITNCDGLETSVGLSFVWQVTEMFSTKILSIQSQSKETSRFTIPPFSLMSGKIYNIKVQVSDSISKLVGYSIVTVEVLRSPLVAKLEPSTMQVLRAGKGLFLDASTSFDPDKKALGEQSTLVYTWHCHQIVNGKLMTFATCPVSVNNSISNKLHVLAEIKAINTTSRIQLIVSNTFQNATSSVDIVVVEPAAPMIIINTALSDVSNVNTNKNLLLSGSIQSETGCEGKWIVNDRTISLANNTLAPYRQFIAANTISTTVYMYLSSNTLSGGGAYLFTLSCGSSSASIVVQTNAGPTGGALSTHPKSGTELLTVFAITTKSWIDTNIPILYQFGFLAPSKGSLMTLQSPSEVSYVSSSLPAGSGPFNKLSGVVVAYDSLGASSSITEELIVIPLKGDNLQQMLQNTVSASNSSGSLEKMKQTISVASSILSRVNCTLAPNCVLLNRENCSLTAGTCGKCLPGYVGSVGDDNSQCILRSTLESALFSNFSSSRICSKDSDCNTPWEYCQGSFRNKKCRVLPKTCVNDCSGNGDCEFHDTNTGTVIYDCTIFDVACEATCFCKDGYAGRDCSMTHAEMETQQALRLNLLASLAEVTEREDVSESSIVNTISSVTSLIHDEHDIDSAAADVFHQVADTTIQNTVSLSSVDYADISKLLDPLDATLSFLSKDKHRRAKSRKLLDFSSASHTSIDVTKIEKGLKLLSSFGDFLMKTTVPGQAALDFTNQNFRLSTQSFLPGVNQNYTVEIPRNDLEIATGESSSTVSIPANLETAANMQMIELKSKLFQFPGDPLVSLARTASVGPKSNLISISIRGVSELFVKVQHTTFEDTTAPSKRFELTTQCKGQSDHHEESYTCPDSGHVIHHTCQGKSGNVTTQCPVYSHRCQILNITTGSLRDEGKGLNSSCQLWNYTAQYTYCRCSLNLSPFSAISSNSRRLDGISNALEDSNAMTLVSMSSFLASDVDHTFTAAPSLTDSKAVERVLTVIIMFSALWVGGITLILGCLWRSHAQKPIHEKNKDNLKRKTLMNEQIRSPVAIYDKICEYVHAVFPAVYNHTSPLIRLQEELRKNHRYLKLFTAPQNEMGDQTRIMTGIQLITTQSMLMFFLALFYDLQGPDDDGTCVNFSDEKSCLARKSIFDNTQTYCQWGYSVNQQIDVCTFNDESISLLAAIYAAVIVSIVSSLFMKPLDYFFEILSAPTADALKAKLQGTTGGVTGAMEQRMVAVAQGVRRVARRMSAFASNTMQQPASRRSINSMDKIKAGVSTRHIPEEVNEAHDLARSSMALIATTAQQELQRYALRHVVLMRQGSTRADEHSNECDSDSDQSSSDDRSNGSDKDRFALVENLHSATEDGPRNDLVVRPIENVESSGIVKGHLVISQQPTYDINASFVRLQEEIHTQRRLLHKEEVEMYDMQWGLDPSGEFVQEHYRSLQWWTATVPLIAHCFPIREGAVNNIKREMYIAQNESAKKIDKLSIATDTHIGMEILHSFILDVLGRDTAAATIFRSNTEEEFRHATVVTLPAKYTAGIAIFLLNVFFAYYAVLKGFVKGVTWQYDYLIACIVQMLVEILLFETLECLWMNFFVPNLVSAEVQEVHTLLMETVNELCRKAANHGRSLNSEEMRGEEEEESRYFLNASDYLFTSTKIAKAYPELMESMIVLSYHNHLPGELSKKWRLGSNLRIHRQQQRGNGRSWRNVAVVAIGITILQSLAASPFFLQRMIIRFVQPFVLGGLMLMWMEIVDNALALGIFCVIIALLVLVIIYRYNQDQRHMKLRSDSNSGDSVIIVCDNIENIPFIDIPQIYDKQIINKHMMRDAVSSSDNEESEEDDEEDDEESVEDVEDIEIEENNYEEMKDSVGEDDEPVTLWPPEDVQHMQRSEEKEESMGNPQLLLQIHHPTSYFPSRSSLYPASSLQSLRSSEYRHSYSANSVPSGHTFDNLSSLSTSTFYGDDTMSSLTESTEDEEEY